MASQGGAFSSPAGAFSSPAGAFSSPASAWPQSRLLEGARLRGLELDSAAPGRLDGPTSVDVERSAREASDSNADEAIFAFDEEVASAGAEKHEPKPDQGALSDLFFFAF